MKFYVNQICTNEFGCLPYEKMYVGLFRECETDGRGNFCGYYGSEYYLHTELYAHYVAKGGGCYSPKERISDVVVHDPAIQYDEVMIGSHIWTGVIEADTVAEAVDLFTKGEWRKWRFDNDAITKNQ